MASIDFPNNPQIDDIHIHEELAWSWDGVSWKRLFEDHNFSSKIGVGTSAPQEEIHIRSVTPVIRIEDIDGGYMQIVGSDGSIRFDADNTNSIADTNVRFIIDGSEKFRIDSDGKVGIGTNSPDQDVFGDAEKVLHMKSSNVATLRLESTHSVGSDFEIAAGNSQRNVYMWNKSNGGILFATNNSESMRIHASGNVDIGNSSSNVELKVNDHKVYHEGNLEVDTAIVFSTAMQDTPEQKWVSFTIPHIGGSGTSNYYYFDVYGYSDISTMDSQLHYRLYIHVRADGTNENAINIKPLLIMDDPLGGDASEERFNFYYTQTSVTDSKVWIHLPEDFSALDILSSKLESGGLSPAISSMFAETSTQPSGLISVPIIESLRTEGGTDPKTYIKGKVGIGTAAPSRTLELVDGTNDGSGGLKVRSYLPVIELQDMSANAGSSKIQQDQLAMKIGPTTSDTYLVLNTEDTERMRIDADGNVTITGGMLDIAGEINFTGTRSAFVQGLSQPRIYRSGDGGTYPFNNWGHLVLQARTDSANRDIVLATGTNGANLTVFDQYGNVDIKTGRLKVRSSNIMFNNEETIIGAPTADGALFRYDNNFFSSNSDALVIEKTDTNGNNPDGGIAFTNRGADGIVETSMVIKGNGNVGIGTTLPLAPIHASVPSTSAGGTYVGLFENLSSQDSSQHGVKIIVEPTPNTGVGNYPLVISNDGDTTENHCFLVRNDGRVDIGYTGGGTKLSIAGGVGTQNGSATSPTHTFYSDTDTGAYRAAQNQYAISTGGSERVRVDENGFVGIGTGNPTSPLHVKKTDVATKYVDAYSTMVIEDTEARLQLCALNAGTNAAAITLSNGANHWTMHHRGPSTTGYLAFGHVNTTTTSDIVQAAMSTTATLSLHTDGNVGIGTSAPATTLQVRESTDATTAEIRISSADSGIEPEGFIVNKLSFAQEDVSGGGDATGITGAIGMRSAKLLGEPTFYGVSADMGFFVSGHSKGNASDNASLEAMTIQRGTGNVGIGTSAPATKLHVEGSLLVNVYENATQGGGIYFRGQSSYITTNPYNMSILAYDHSNSGLSADGLSINAYDGISFCTGSNTREQRMIINHLGNVGIGISASTGSYKLSMGGSLHMNNSNIDYVNQLHFQSNVRFYDESNDSYLTFKWGDTGWGGIRFVDGNSTTQGFVAGDGQGTFGLFVGSEWAVKAISNGETQLYYDGSEKLNTKSTGVDITGDLGVSGAITEGGTLLSNKYAPINATGKWDDELDNSNQPTGDIYYNSGNVGIGVTSVSSLLKLRVNGKCHFGPGTRDWIPAFDQGNSNSSQIVISGSQNTGPVLLVDNQDTNGVSGTNGIGCRISRNNADSWLFKGIADGANQFELRGDGSSQLGLVNINSSGLLTASQIWSTGNITSSGNISASGTVKSKSFQNNPDIVLDNNGQETTGSELSHVVAPDGASRQSVNSPETGAIKITLPFTWTNTMMYLKVRIYEYGSSGPGQSSQNPTYGNNSVELHIAGYSSLASAGWYQTSAFLHKSGMSMKNVDYNVRFGHDGSKCCVFIGETNTNWSYPQVIVTDATFGYYNYDTEDWSTGWDVSMESSLASNIDVTIFTGKRVNLYKDITKLTTATTTTLVSYGPTGSTQYNGQSIDYTVAGFDNFKQSPYRYYDKLEIYTGEGMHTILIEDLLEINPTQSQHYRIWYDDGTQADDVMYVWFNTSGDLILERNRVSTGVSNAQFYVYRIDAVKG